MTTCIIKTIILYIIIIAIILIIKPSFFYYDQQKKVLKNWDLYRETKNINDLCNFHLVVIGISIMCFIICNAL